jgi:DNA repair protein RadC
MTYAFKLPPELMGRMVQIREKTKISLAQQVRDAVKIFCDMNLNTGKQSGEQTRREYQIKTKVKFLTVKEATQIKIRNSEIAYEIMRTEAKIDRECGWVLHLNGRSELIEKELVSMGMVGASYMHPREIFKKAIINGASAIIIIHNHPSGDTTPSKDDREISRRLKEAGELIGIEVNDFIIISSRGYVSFVDEKIGEF